MPKPDEIIAVCHEIIRGHDEDERDELQEQASRARAAGDVKAFSVLSHGFVSTEPSLELTFAGFT